MTTDASGPLKGINVVDMTTELSGPYATRIMGDLGANIIKIEPPQGDGQRRSGPSRHPAMASQFLQTNRNKRSIGVNLKNEEGRSVLLKLCETADVLLYNIRRKAMARLRLTYEDVSKVNPRIIYCGVCGYGEDGPYADKPAYDDVIQGMTGMAALTARVNNGVPGYVPLNIVDRTCSLVLVQSMLAALLHRERTGEGQAVELPLFETMAEFVLSDHMYGRTFSPPIADMGNTRTLQRWPAKTRDGYICFWLARDEMYPRFWDAIGRPDMKTEERFATRAERNKRLPELLGIIGAELVKKTTSEWTVVFAEVDVPMMPMHTLESLWDDEHLRQTGFFSLAEHPTEGEIVSMAVTSRWSKSKPSNLRPAPRLGEHTREILSEAGMTDAEVERLVASGAVFCA